MLFNSIHFLIFFPVVTTIYFLLPHRFRWMLLLAASCYFYMAFIPAYILILAVTIVIDYFAGIYIERSEGKKRKKYLAVSIVSLILVLFVFKYFNFVNQSFADVFRTFELEYPVENIGLILPIGLSFHTFQSLSYVVEVYRGRQKAEKNFGIYSLFVMFYPQLVAGPIERPQQLLYQFYERHKFEYRRIADGLKLMAWGMFKKVVIADRLAVFVNQVYDNPQNYEGISMVIATVFFAFQIYCDFSGYSDIAIGSAQVMGFKLMQNFNRPYFSKSISEFWKRWHISLSTWFRDYLYIPLGGNRVGIPRWYFNLFFTFMVSGLWHGANWTFVIWGALHGTYLIIGILTRDFRQKFTEITGLAKAKRLHRFLQVMITAALVCFSWVFFRAMNLHDAMLILANMFRGIGNVTQMFGPDRVHILYLGRNMLEFSICILLIGFLGIVELIQRRGSIIEMINSKPAVYRWALYYIILVAIILLGQYEISQRFIYFQF
ncbi:MAG: MBOAT family protein [Ignavibacteria bacterium]|nr:MBOAT family protein [Ignavibacteria bacterium]